MTVPREDPRANRTRAFTLIELLVAMAILALLSSLAYPMIQMAMEAARRAKCAEHLRQIGQVLVCEGLKPGGFPYKKGAGGSETLALLYERGLIGEEEVYSCPGSGDSCTDLESIRSSSSYAFRVGLQGMPVAAKAVPLACDDSVDHHGDGFNVLYSDGRVVFVRATELPEGLVD